MSPFFRAVAAFLAVNVVADGFGAFALDRRDLRKMMGKSGGASKSSKSTPSPTSAPAVEGVVNCGDTIVKATKLTSDLFCTECVFRDTVLTVDGTSLDCQGFSILGAACARNRFTVGVTLVNGATLANCEVSRFSRGIRMLEGDNTVLNSIANGNGQFGLLSEPEDLVGSNFHTIENFTAIGNDEDGIILIPFEQADYYLEDIVASYNGRSGLNFQPYPPSTFRPTTSKLEIHNVVTIGNGDDGLHFESYADSSVVAYGSIVSEQNGNFGVYLLCFGAPTGLDVFLNEDVSLQYNVKGGISGEEGDCSTSLTLGEFPTDFQSFKVPDIIVSSHKKSGKMSSSKKSGKMSSSKKSGKMSSSKKSGGEAKSTMVPVMEGEIVICQNGVDSATDFDLNAAPDKIIDFEDGSVICETTNGDVDQCATGCPMKDTAMALIAV